VAPSQSALATTAARRLRNDPLGRRFVCEQVRALVPGFAAAGEEVGGLSQFGSSGHIGAMLESGSTERRSDEDLLAAIARRDPDACSVFYRRHLQRAVAYVMGQTHDPEVTADIVGEVFAAVIAGAGRYRPERDSAAPWVMGIARNVLSASRRRGRVEDRMRRRLGVEPVELDEADVRDTEAMASVAGGGVVELVAALPYGEREAVKARIVDERGYSEIAAELRCSELVVRKRVSRGLGRLRKQLEKS